MAPTPSHDPNPSEMMASSKGGRLTAEVPSHPSHGKKGKAAPAISDPMDTPKSKSTDDAPAESSKHGGKWTIDMPGNVDAKPESDAMRLVMAAIVENEKHGAKDGKPASAPIRDFDFGLGRIPLVPLVCYPEMVVSSPRVVHTEDYPIVHAEFLASPQNSPDDDVPSLPPHEYIYSLADYLESLDGALQSVPQIHNAVTTSAVLARHPQTQTLEHRKTAMEAMDASAHRVLFSIRLACTRGIAGVADWQD
ncbi:hypothetical protein JOL62DRAFT_613992 [Phyllosticta paracitricarpa]|uniref:Uncharacterized protein n=1 Tax=Phyllosticta paracitricarpa TaxID=2016321 RepID=A0ABR1N2X6_9PEZI